MTNLAIDNATVKPTLNQLVDAAEAAIAGRRGAPAKRMWINARVSAMRASRFEDSRPRFVRVGEWETRQVMRRGLGLARMAGLRFDEHGSTRGDYRSTSVLDYVAPTDAKAAPYCDMGGGGLALVEVERKRVYAKSSKWWPQTTSDRYLVGRNESGTFFAHAVTKKVSSVREALDWMWGGLSEKIVRRQGDVAVVSARGPKMPASLPSGHLVNGDKLEHATHPTIALPQKGERLIVARRAVARAADETRD